MSSSESILLGDLLQCLVECSRKGARIAQVFREDHQDDLLAAGLLVEDKGSNERFLHDFKTLADVLVQATIHKDVGERFPSLVSNIKGEEQNSFQNSLGESIRVELTSSTDETAELLSKVLDGRDHIARELAEVVHSKEFTCERQYSSSYSVQADSIGVWIDPIDSTTEYIQGNAEETEVCGIQPCGLKCVCVLIGVHELGSGRPILGVVNQPFYQKVSDTTWDSRFYWAINLDTEQVTSPTMHSPAPKEKITVISSCESHQLQEIISRRYKLVYTAGAGNKALLVACRKADLYVISLGTTYLWDICGPHAMLAASGGGIVRFDELMDIKDIRDLEARQILYFSSGKVGSEAFRNCGGLIAYRNPEDALELVQLLRESGYPICKL